MSALDTAKDIVRLGTTAGLSKDVIDLLEKKSALLKEQVGMLENEITHLKLENAKLRQQLQHFQPSAHGLSEEYFAVLKVLESSDDNMLPFEVAAALRSDEARTHYVLTKLRRDKYVLEVSTGFQICDKGRDALHER